MEADIADHLESQARLAAALLAGRHDIPDPDGEADALGRSIHARVTLHRRRRPRARRLRDRPRRARRPRESLERARKSSRPGGPARASDAAPAPAPAWRPSTPRVKVRDSDVAFARIALPLTAVDARVAAVRRSALAGLLAGFVVALARGLDRVATAQPARRRRGRGGAAIPTRRLRRPGARLRPRRDRHRRRRARRHRPRARRTLDPDGDRAGAHGRDPHRHGRGHVARQQAGPPACWPIRPSARCCG